jgi:hypothetical protein
LRQQRLRRFPIDPPISFVIHTEQISFCIIHQNKLIARNG